MLVPPFAPLQPQVKFQGVAVGVATPVGVPLEQRFAVGAVVTAVELLAEPHAPLEGWLPKFAMTVRGLDIDTTQVVAVPLQSPPQPDKVNPDVGVAVKVTAVPGAKLAEQVPPALVQSMMPAGALSTSPPAVAATVSARPG